MSQWDTTGQLVTRIHMRSRARKITDNADDNDRRANTAAVTAAAPRKAPRGQQGQPGLPRHDIKATHASGAARSLATQGTRTKVISLIIQKGYETGDADELA